MLTNSNFFKGEGYDRIMANNVYEALLSRKVCRYTDFMEAYLMKPLESNKTLSSYDEYPYLKKAVGNVVKEIRRVLGEDAIIENPNPRDKTYQYVGEDPDPLKRILQSIPLGIREYIEFCRDSAGFIPEEWLTHFLKGSIVLHDIYWSKDKAQRGVLMSHNNELKNIGLLPVLYEAIKNKQLLRIEYSQFDGINRIVWLSPHFLREFNGRWYVSGYSGKRGTNPYNVPLDRITKFESAKGEYREAPLHLYRDWFDDLIGVARYEGATLEDVVIRTHSSYIHGLVMTKRFHHSQEEAKPFGQHPDGTYGEIRMRVLLNPDDKNKEFRGKILTFGSELEVISPLTFRQEIAQEVSKLIKSYQQ